MSAFINEFHYDNDSTDVGEFVEIAAPGGFDLTGWTLVLYNGSNGGAYNTIDLAGTVSDQANGFGFVVVNFPTNGIQNGSPDGMALVDADGNVVEFLSYEGSFTANDGPATGQVSTDIGVSESGSTPVGFSLQREGTGTTLSDFTFTAAQAETPGAVNTGQTFVSAVMAPTLISEFQPNPDGGDPANVTIELSGEAGETFSGTLLSIENDGVNGLIDRLTDVSGTFDENGLLTVEIPDLENPSFTFVLTDGTGTASLGDDLDADDDGMIDDASVLGTVLDAIGIPDNDADAAVLYAEQLGGTNFAFTGTEPELVFRSGSTGDLFAVNDVVAGTEIFNTAAETFTAADFDQNPIVNDTFGAINPTFGDAPDPDPEPEPGVPTQLTDQVLASVALNGAEIVKTRPDLGLAFVTSGDGLQIVDFNDLANITFTLIDPSANSSSTSTEITSVDVNADGLVVVSYPGDVETDNGAVQFYDTAGTFLGSVEVGPLPDMVTFDPTGAYVLTANEGESNDPEENSAEGDPNPNGSVSIITVDTDTPSNSAVSTFDFSDPSITFETLRAAGVRVDERAPSPAADLEPEFIAVEGVKAFITLQENNAVAVIDDITNFAGFTIDNLIGLGTQDFSTTLFDPSNRDDGINLTNFPVNGLRMPDAIASFVQNGVTYFAVANEGDGRGDFDETLPGDEARGDDLLANFVDTTEVSQELQDALADDALLGRLKFSTIDGDTDGDGLIEELVNFGGRSFSIFDESGNLVFDSGDDFESFIAAQLPEFHNSDDGHILFDGEDEVDGFDGRSDDKGPEPEAITIGQIGSSLYAFVALERVGGVAVYDITDVNDVQFDSYIRNEERVEGFDAENGAFTIDADIAPEGLDFISAEDSPTGEAILVIANEVSNTLTFHELADDFTAIHDIQGSTDFSPNEMQLGSITAQVTVDDVSPLVGEVVTVQAIVTADFQSGDTTGAVDQSDLGGFYLQEEDIDADLDAFSSEGIFVFDDGLGVDVNVGDLVEVTGTVTEFFGETQISATMVEVVDTNQTLPTATVVDLGSTGAILDDDGEWVVDLEAFEGMLITIPEDLSVTEMFNLDRFGEYRVSSDGRLEQFTQNNAPSVEGFAAHQEDIAARSLVLDDGRTDQNPENIEIIDGNDGVLTASDSFRMGDTLNNVTGVVSYAFDEFRLNDATGDYTQSNPRPSTPEDVGGDLKVASLNVLNYFTTIDVSGASTDTGLDPRGADSAEEFARQREKLVNAIVEMDADILGLVEIENSATDAAVADLVQGINDKIGTETYGFIATGVIGGDAIAQALIYKIDTVTPAGEFQTLETFNGTDFTDPLDAGRPLNRPALAQTFEENSSGETLTVAVNHLKSKGSLSGLADDNDQGDGAGNNNATREAAAALLAEWLATDPTGQGSENVLILGDLNSYQEETPITTLEAAGFTDLAELFVDDPSTPESENRSFVFDGQFGTLDYALANAALLPFVTGATEWHINADEADAIDYNLDFGRDPALFDGTSPARHSDHDPVLIGLDLTPNTAPVAVADTFTTTEGAELVVSAEEGVLANDSDPEDDALTAALIAGPANAADFILNDDGSFTYTPVAGFTGDDTFTYAASDGELSATETVTVSVEAEDDSVISGTDGVDFLRGTEENDVFLPGAGFVDVIDLRAGGDDTIVFGSETSNGVREFDYVLGFGSGDRLDLGGATITEELNFFGRTFLFLDTDDDVILLFGVNDFDESSQLLV